MSLLTQEESEKVAALKASLPDLQKSEDIRGISINRVGIENVDFQLNIARKDGGVVTVQATVDLFCSLTHALKGINMSRLVEVLMAYKDQVLTPAGIEHLLNNLQERMGLGVEDTYFKIKFKYFVPKIAPVSKQESTMAHDCSFTGILKDKKFTFLVGVGVLVTSNCPCSKEISKYGAHGQRSRCSVTIEGKDSEIFWLEDLIPLIEAQGSCEIYPLLKRVDEKYVTEKAYENPKFVEDISRDIAGVLQATDKVKRFKVRVANEESIHHHDAVSLVARKLEGTEWVSDEEAFKG